MNEISGRFSTAPNFPAFRAHDAAPTSLLLLTAKLVASGGEYLCVVRDAGPDGLTITIFHPLPPDDAMMIEMASGSRYAVEPLSEGPARATLRFRDPADILRFLAEDPHLLRKRPVRLRLVAQGILYATREALPIELRDISQQRACIACESRLAVDERVRLEFPQLPTIVAKVRWRRDGLYGLVFEQTFRFDELARLTGPLQGATQDSALKEYRG